MPSPLEELRAVGIDVGTEDARLVLRAECMRLARRVRERRARLVGLAPAGDDVAVPAIAIELGRALAATGITAVGVVDAHGSWPCARRLTASAAAGADLLATSWLFPNVAVLTPRAPRPGDALERLHGALVRETASFGELVVDLTGFDHRGEHVAAFELLDAVALVARCGRTTARQIQRRLRDVPDRRDLGVLLTGS